MYVYNLLLNKLYLKLDNSEFLKVLMNFYFKLKYYILYSIILPPWIIFSRMQNSLKSKF